MAPTRRFVIALVLAVASVVVVADRTAPPVSAAPSESLAGASRGAASVAASSSHTCAIDDADQLRCWGRGGQGQLGTGSTAHVGDSPSELGDALGVVDIGSGRTVRAVTAGGRHTCVLRDDATVVCFGLGTFGRLGNGSTANIGDGTGEMGNSLVPVGFPAGRTAVSIDAGTAHTCAVLDNGDLMCWGSGQHGQLGLGSTSDIGDTPGELATTPPIDLGTGRTAIAVSAGDQHTCAILDDNTAKCWGAGADGRLGSGAVDDVGDGPGEMGASLPVIDLGSSSFVGAISAGFAHTCAIVIAGPTVCWGRGADGNLGTGSTASIGDGPGEMGAALVPIDFGSGSAARSVVAANAISCAHLSDGNIKCWGSGANGALGTGNTDSIGDQLGEVAAAPNVDLGPGRTALAVTAALTESTVCALRDDHTLTCWGDGDLGRLGNGRTTTIGDQAGEMGRSLVPVPLAGTAFIGDEVSAGSAHVCALSTSGSVKCWGEGNFGRLGYGDTIDRGDGPNEMGDSLSTVDLGTGSTADAVNAGGEHTCAVLSNNALKCWGYNFFGQLGTGNNFAHLGDAPGEMGDNLAPVDLGTGRTVTQVASGSYTICAILDDDTVKCWGRGSFGMLGRGDGDTSARGDGPNEMGDNLPVVNLGTGRTARQLAAGPLHVCALLDDFTVKCWGHNGAGRLGYGDTDDRGDAAGEMGDNLPAVNLGAGRTARQLAAGEEQVCALLDNATVKCWGAGSAGRLGHGDENTRGDSPGEMGDSLPTVDLGTGRSAAAVTAGSGHTCALLDNDTVKCWGFGLNGQLGYGDTTTRGDSPGEMGDNLPAVDVGTGRTVRTIAARSNHTCAVLDDRTLKCWGRGTYGVLGTGDLENRGDNPAEMGDDLAAVELSWAPGTFATRTSAPTSPTSPAATGGTESATITWAAPFDDGGAAVTGYRVQASTDNGVTWTTGVTVGVVTSTTISGLSSSNAFRFRIAAINAVGTGPNSLPTLAVSPTMAPAPVVTSPFVSLDPQRFADTRSTGETIDDRFEAAGKRADDSDYRVQITGRGQVPAGARGVIANITAVAAERNGFVTVHPCVSPRPVASSLNYTSGVNIASEIVAPLTTSGELCIAMSEPAHLIVDVVGFVPADTVGIELLTPARFLDTRSTGETIDGQSRRTGLAAAGSTTVLQIAGRNGIPAGAKSAVVNITGIQAQNRGFITVHPCLPAPPTAASLNYAAGVNRANEIIAQLDGQGRICIFTSAVIHLAADVAGYVPTSTTATSVGPARLLDTRSTGLTIDGRDQAGGRRAAGSQTTLQITGRPGVPAGARTAILYVTAVQPDAPGFVTVHPCQPTLPNASSLNFVTAVNGGNEIITRLDANGRTCIFTSAATQLTVDIVATT